MGRLLQPTISHAETVMEPNCQTGAGQDLDLLEILMNSLPDSIYFKDAASRFLRINQAMADRFGLVDPAAAVGKTDFDFFSEDHARQAYASEQHMMRTGQAVL